MLLIEGAVVAVVSMLIGWVAGRAGRPRVPRPVEAAPVLCSCGHPWGMHTEDDGCDAQVERPLYNSFGRDVGEQWVPCRCVRYDGPLPLSAYEGPRGFDELTP